MFYPEHADELRRRVDALVHAAPNHGGAMPKALIVPHAGYVYSGPIAANAYACLAGAASRIRRVVVLGPTHRVPVRGIALPDADEFATPLGRIRIDADLVQQLAAMPRVVPHPSAHALEHSIEVQLPFLQVVLGEFSLLPLAVGVASSDEVAAVLDAVWGGEETLIVVSSDLSHYLPYDRARIVDSATASAVLALRPDVDHQQACGATPVNGLLKAAARLGLRVEMLDLRNSGDTAGDRSRVVGYAAFAFFEPAPQQALPQSERVAEDLRGEVLLPLARGAIADELGIARPPSADASFLHEPAATFVTLRRHGALRGCIGSLEAHRALGEDVRHNARAAAFADLRFAPVARHEFDDLRVEVSILSPAQPIDVKEEDELLARLRPGVDGVILSYRDRRGTFLPQVWDTLPDARDFLAQLKRKAGLAATFWHRDVRVERYTVTKFAEAGAS
jgi:AmmeMemoRadiSam system protein B/AmmeMemoRadiSam system protein A